MAVQHQFGRQPIFFPGDFGQTGSATETRLLVPQLAKFKQPIVAVSGNHDVVGLPIGKNLQAGLL